MASLQVKNLDGNSGTLEESALRPFLDAIEGTAITPGDSGYDEARAVWNATVDKRPALIVRCAGTGDIRKCVGFAGRHSLLTAVRGAGHNIAGNAVCDGGLVIDLSLMKTVTVDAGAKTVRVEPGATLGDLDAAAQVHGLAVPVGINSTTGIAGLTLGGGFGWLSRKHGLTIDNLLSAEVVTAAGETVTASEKSHPDLFWGLRGGGGNFGVVSAFTFRLHPVGPEVLSGLIVHPGNAAPSLMREYRKLAAQAPEELTVWVVLRKAPPLPFLPEDVHGTDVMVLAALYAGNMAEGEKAMKPFRELGTPIADVISPHPYAGFQTAFDPLLTPGARNYWKSHNFAELTDDAIDLFMKYARSLPSDQSEVFVAQMGGATARVAPDATAYMGREANFILNVHTRWEDSADDARCIAWAREFFQATAPHATGGVYVNFMPDDEQDRVKAAYGPNYERLAALKKTYDPGNLFRMNQNIRP
jgi:FAD/FMN-containing dehydrogenase